VRNSRPAAGRNRILHPCILVALLGVAAGCARLIDVERERTASNRRNVILISMDTLRADHLSCYGYFRKTSPHIDSLAGRGTRFADVSSTSAWTTPVHGSLFTGRYPLQLGSIRYHGGKKMHVLGAEEETLAELLQDAGYETQAFTGGGFVSRKLGFDQGFVKYRDHNNIKDYIDQLLEWLTEHDRSRPFFLFVHFYDTHRPYIPPDEKFKEMFKGGYKGNFPVRKVCSRKYRPLSEEDLRYVISQYDGEIAHADYQLGRFFAHLHDTGLDRNTLLVYLSDHGDEFFEHGDCDHTTSVYQELVGVPLVFKGPGIPARQVVQVPVSLIDVPPTILHYLGMPVPDSMEGTSLLPVIHGEGEPCTYQFFETSFWKRKNDIRGVREGPWKIVFNYKDVAVEAYDLEIDPLERTNVIEEMPAGTKRDMIHAFKKWRKKMRKTAQKAKTSTHQSITTDPKLEEHLKALGYIMGE
jgi:arylsulfatase A-like enzyme